MNNTEKYEPLDKARVFESLTNKELFNLMMWELFNKKKINKFYENLKSGRSAKSSYNNI